ncbi:ferritin-like domain-containing protein [Hymenobacter sp. HSC-4F20]|uniref:ferritin-like domain-containing protein n=1 Tax=Hymenobacter sp. HSC-4F20 TaxID=2864135 RepID=UPI001C732F23|nr:ferritin-like domain-containing protein [Hymenobacter sp. HSC-4F20]MBX0289043.1 ferritin-like domain-containing protein [Hymenobacter sp. HSC-4F20]
MDLFKLISDIEKVDPEVYERLDPRRRVFKHFGLAGKAVTAAMLPGLVSGIFQRAYGQTTSLTPEITQVLNLALSLEYLEFYFYDSGLKASNLIPATDRPAFETIRNDESGHIKVLREVLGTAAIADPTRDAFDYTGGKGLLPGPFATVFTDYKIFLGVAQSFVDTGVRAYKGGAPVLMPNKDILESALNIHSVEARHSSHVRTVRRGVELGNATATAVAGDLNNLNKIPKSWISGIDNGGPSPNTTPSTTPVYGAGNPAATYPAENNTTQAGVPIENSAMGITAAAASEAFDEPLDPTTVKSIARNFVKATTTLFV